MFQSEGKNPNCESNREKNKKIEDHFLWRNASGGFRETI